MLAVCETNPSVGQKSPFQPCEFIEVWTDRKIDVARVTVFSRKMHLIGDSRYPCRAQTQMTTKISYLISCQIDGDHTE